MTRTRVALGAVIAAALLPAAGVLVQVMVDPKVFRPRDDPMSSLERPLAPLREVLLAERVVGYLAPPQLVQRLEHLYALRYALAPVQVIDSVDLPLVIAEGVADLQRLPPELRVRRDFGGGLLLLEHAR